MKRRTLLAALGASAVAGCLADDSGTDDGGNDPLGTAVPPDSVAGQFDGEPTRPACTVESESIEVSRGDETETYETAPTVPYPEAPSSLETETILEYVEAFEHAYVTKDVLCDWTGSDHVLNVGFSVRRYETVERPDGVTVVSLVRAGGATLGTDGEHLWAAELAPEGVAYAIDETGLARADFDEPPGRTDDLESAAPDPLTAGELVAVFDDGGK